MTDPTLNEIVKELMEEFELPKSHVEKVVKHFFNWQRQSFIDLEYSDYNWKYFGNFKVIKKRLTKKIKEDAEQK